jgi:hypothetical protein
MLHYISCHAVYTMLRCKHSLPNTNDSHSHLTASAYENITGCLYDTGVRAFLMPGARWFLRIPPDLTKNFLQKNRTGSIN